MTCHANLCCVVKSGSDPQKATRWFRRVCHPPLGGFHSLMWSDFGSNHRSDHPSSRSLGDRQEMPNCFKAFSTFLVGGWVANNWLIIIQAIMFFDDATFPFQAWASLKQYKICTNRGTNPFGLALSAELETWKSYWFESIEIPMAKWSHLCSLLLVPGTVNLE